MPTTRAATGRRHRLAPAVTLALALSLLATGTTNAADPPSREPAVGPVDIAAAPTPYRVNLATRADFVPQTTFVQCVGASVQMMRNIVGPDDDRSRRTQRQLQDLARAWSGPTPRGFERRGASVRGWAAGLVISRAGPYRVVGADSLQGAMHLAAEAIRETGRPVGLLVWRGRHAWVMAGFEATADPLLADGYRVTKAYILDPLYPHGSKTWGPSPKPGSAISVAAVGRQFVPRRRGASAWNNLPGGSWLAGKYVLVIPTGPIRPGIE
jgi:hypothetical protein